MDTKTHQHKVLIISAPSGAGKTTIVKSILKSYPKLAFSISATTRPKRESEQNGVDYYFLSEKTFREQINQNNFIEWEMVYKGKYYGTLKSELERIWALSQIPLLEVDVKGAIRIKNENPNLLITNIFIKAPSISILKDRLIKRGSEDSQTIEERIKKAEFELQFMSHFDHIILNNDLHTCLNEVDKVVRKVLSS